MCPSAWVMSGPMAMYRTVQSWPQRTTMVRALASVAASRSPARTPALTSSVPDRPWVPVAPGVAVGEVGSVSGAEPGRHEAGAFHADVAAAGQAGGRERDHGAVRGDGEEAPAGLARGDQVTAIAAE